MTLGAKIKSAPKTNTFWIVLGWSVAQGLLSAFPDWLADHPDVRNYVSIAVMFLAGVTRAYQGWNHQNTPKKVKGNWKGQKR